MVIFLFAVKVPEYLDQNYDFETATDHKHFHLNVTFLCLKILFRSLYLSKAKTMFLIE
jgi:hypothetical protein